MSQKSHEKTQLRLYIYPDINHFVETLNLDLIIVDVKAPIYQINRGFQCHCIYFDKKWMKPKDSQNKGFEDLEITYLSSRRVITSIAIKIYEVSSTEIMTTDVISPVAINSFHSINTSVTIIRKFYCC
jgi:hypothetical protein